MTLLFYFLDRMTFTEISCFWDELLWDCKLSAVSVNNTSRVHMCFLLLVLEN
jgi:hypothetical protein